MIFTFYSYKGGVGRSMAVANIAELLYEKGCSVLMIDWDLDSPGLETYFPHISQKAKENPGLLNMLLSYKSIVSRKGLLHETNFELTERSLLMLKREEIPQKVFSQLESLKGREYTSKESFIADIKHLVGAKQAHQWQSMIVKHALQLQFGEINDYIVDVYSQTTDNNGSKFLKLLSAGKRDEAYFTKYVKHFKSFEWKNFYELWAGEQYFEWFRRKIEHVAPIILIDSRNGVNEMSGICTHQLADVVIAFTSSNYQSIEGTERIVEQLKSSRLRELRSTRSRLGVVVVPARVESGELAARNKFEKQFKEKFDTICPEHQRENGYSFWNLKIPYMPLYAFEERVAVREKREKEGIIAKELEEAYQKIWDAMVSEVSPPGEEPWRWRPQTGKVLIVEDDPQWQNMLKGIVVAKAGVTPEFAQSKESALSLIRDHDYELIIVNLSLSSSGLDSIRGYEGIDILDFLKATGRKMPVLLIISESISTRNIFDQYPFVKDCLFKGRGKNLVESIRKYLDIQ